MHDWPAEGGIPSPHLVAAWLVLGTLPTERIPLWAAHWLASGYDGDAIAELAGLHGDDPHEVRDALGPALTECGITTSDAGSGSRAHRTAAATAFAAIATLQVDALVSERWVVDRVADVLALSCYDGWVIGLPLGCLFDVDDEWGADWGRATDQLREVVRQACARQVRIAHAGDLSVRVGVQGVSAGRSHRTP